MFYSIMHFNFSNTLSFFSTKKLNSERILLMRYSAIWPLTHGKQEVGDADIGFWWWSDMQTAPSKMLLEIYTTNALTQDSEFFSSSNLLRYFIESNSFLWQIYCIGGKSKKRVYWAPYHCPRCTLLMYFIYLWMHFCQNIQKYGWMQCTWSIGKDEGNIWQVGEVPLIILVHMTPPCLTTESIQSIFSM